MSDRAVSRHRAPQRAVTPLSEMTEALTGQIAMVGRSGAIVAMSTGLVASVASVPAQAQGTSTTAVAALDTSVPSALTAHSLSAGRSSVLIGSVNLAHGASVSAPSAATVTFDTDAFKAAPAPVRKKVVKVTEAEAETSTSSSNSTSTRSSSPSKSTARAGTSGSSVLAIASRYVGIPYVYGGTTPKGFDCSGYVGYVYRQLGVSLPRTANAQMQATKRISRSEARPGDVVFFVSGGRAYHDGIYAGGNSMYDSPRSGKSIAKREIWSSSVVFGRVTG